MEKPLPRGRQAIDAGGEDRLNGHGHLDGPEVPDQVIASALAGEIPGLREGAYALLEKERIALRPLDEQALEGMQAGVVSEEGAQHGLRTGSRDGIDPQLRVVRPVSHGVLVLERIVRQTVTRGI